MLAGRYFVLIAHQWVDQLEVAAPDKPRWPDAWMGRHITPQNAMHQARHLAGFFQTVRVWDAKEQRLVAEYFQHISLDRDELDPGHEEFYKTVLERPEGKVQTIGKRVIYAFNRHDRNADYEEKIKNLRDNKGGQANGEDIQGVGLDESH